MADNPKTKRKPAATALGAFIACDWAVDREWAEFAKRFLVTGERGAIPERDEAIGVRAGESMTGTRYVYRHGRTGVIDVYGAIVPRANMFTEWSGGTSCELLARDIRVAENDPDIDELLFVIHSPGGEVTGVSELAAQIRDCTTPTRAYVSGMGCSAAYWLASACDRIVVADTAIVGSIGVMAVFLDDSKALEMRGLEEIEFVSSQSPNKNPDPKTPAGRAAVQKRIDALASVFVEAVAANRSVSIETVLSKFGQGGVFVGGEAVKAGLADAVGSFESMFVAGGAAGVETEPGTDPDDEDSVQAAEKQGENQMSQNTDNQPQAKQAVDLAEFEAMKAKVAALESADEANQKMIALLKEERRTAELTELAKTFAGEPVKHVAIMSALANSVGQDSPEFKAYVEQQAALAAQIEAASLFAEQGSDRGGEKRSALARLDELAKVRAAEKGISLEAAFTEVASENQNLYAEYRAEIGG